MDRIDPEVKENTVASLRAVVNEVQANKANEDAEESALTVTPIPTFKLPQSSNEYKKGQCYGWIIFQFYLLPVLPKLKGIWLIANVITSLVLLILSLINTHWSLSNGFIALSIIISILALILSATDGYILYSQQLNRRNESEEAIDWCRCRCQYTHYYNKWYEIVRLLCAEILLYPLLISSLLELLHSSKPTEQNEATVGLIVTLVTYMLSVHILRPVMVLVTLAKLRRLASINKGKRIYTTFFLRLFFHVIEVTFVIFLILLSAGLSIRDKTNQNISAYLWVMIFGGWIASLLSYISFFIINYYWFQQLLLEIFIDVMECSQIPDVSKEVFKDDKEGLSEFLRSISYQSIKQDIIRREASATLRAKIYHPLSLPAFLVFAIAFNILLLAVLFCVFLELVTSSYHVGSIMMLVFVAAAILFTNIHFLLVFNVWLVVLIVIGIPLLIVWIVKALDRKFSQPKEGYVPIK